MPTLAVPYQAPIALGSTQRGGWRGFLDANAIGNPFNGGGFPGTQTEIFSAPIYVAGFNHFLLEMELAGPLGVTFFVYHVNPETGARIGASTSLGHFNPGPPATLYFGATTTAAARDPFIRIELSGISDPDAVNDAGPCTGRLWLGRV